MPIPHPQPLGHVSIGVRNLEVSKRFYTAILTPLGLDLVYETPAGSVVAAAPPPPPSPTGQARPPSGGHLSAAAASGTEEAEEDKIKTKNKPPRVLGYGPDGDHELLNIFEHGEGAHPPGKGCHIAFNAPTRGAVRRFHDAAVRSGGSSDGLPGLRARYGRDYYAAFVVDPDGWRLEAVCKAPGEEE